MNHIGLVIADGVNEDFSALIFWLELNYGPVAKLLPNLWAFKSDDNVVDLLEEAEEFLLGRKAVCFVMSNDIAITNNMANDI